MDWLDALTQLRREGSPGVLVTVVKVRGHAPRDAGAKMVVGSEHSWGSVGGGNLEEAAIRRARDLIAGGRHGTRNPAGPAQRTRPQSARPPMLRRGGDPVAGTDAGPAHRRDLRNGSRRVRAGPDPVPAGAAAGAGRLPARTSWIRCGWPRSPTAPPMSPCTTCCSANRCWNGCPAARTC